VYVCVWGGVEQANYTAWKKAWDAQRAAAKREAKETLRANNIISGRDLFEVRDVL